MANHASRDRPADACFLDCIGAAWQPLTVAFMLRPRRAMCAAPLAPGHPREGGQALDRSPVTDACLREAALVHLDTDFELHRLSHGPGDAALSRLTTTRVVVVRSGSDGWPVDLPDAVFLRGRGSIEAV